MNLQTVAGYQGENMAPVVTLGADQPVDAMGQLISTVLTFGLAALALIYVIQLYRREGIVWPVFLLISGTLCCLMEPLFDHLYGLWFFEQGQWNLYTTFGSAQPVWVPAAYMAFYGGASIVVARVLSRSPKMATIWRLYAGIVAMSIIAEMIYVSWLKVYSYQDSQPFVVLGYPIFLGFTNAMSALIGGIIAYRLAPLLRGWRALNLIPLVPSCFAMGLFGNGILYLSVRHGMDNPPMWLVQIAALSVVLGIAATVNLLGHLLVVNKQQPA
ncbi:hypothetical protein NCG89_13790 [Spongiibacter taiwanensis]|uniref:hypothetical protein n=1 Tax=Spongiibacter taiwanensis TaxID=1748242 RepID=UPI002034FCA7|nr:hypothetical protein [Spongiibacter taiwanensis]USA42601.1 hypothetical protein NCG89_13790 [Spongiibacter taiwanensis]